ncbi:MAG: hypothetical protein V3R93_06510 [Candidatus Hydrothermarchaeaceae archaeon]
MANSRGTCLMPPEDFIPGQTAGGAAPSASEFLPQTGKAELAAEAATPPPQQIPAGIPQGAGMGATQQNPLDATDEQASPEEQEQYEELFLKVMGAVNDVRESPGGTSSADAIVKMMSVKGKEAHVAIGTTAGMIMTQMIDMAKRQGKEYDGRIVQEVGMDLIIELTEIANLSGAIENIPKDDSPEFDKLIELSVLEATKFYGEHQIRTGQADQQGHMNELQGQMQREADSGELDDWGMEELDPQIRDQIVQQMQGGQRNGP